MREQLVITGIALGSGAAFALIAWLVSCLVLAVPSQNRIWHDRPPMGFRILWLPIQWLAFYVEPWIFKKRRENIAVRIRQAGLDYALAPAQFFAARIVWGAVCACAAWWIAGSFKVSSFAFVFMGFGLGYLYLTVWLRDRAAARRRQTLKTLPFYLDLVTLCVESGLNLNGAFQQAVAKGPPGVLREEFQRVLRDIRAGRPRAEALREMAARLEQPAISTFTATLIQAEGSGMSLGPILRAQADQRRTERFARAEKLALEAPVKLLLPLLACIFPAVFIILLFPIAMKLMVQGF